LKICLEQFPTCIEARLEELRQAREYFLQEVESGPNDDERAATGADRWCIAEIVYHLHLAETRTTMGLKRNLESSSRGTPADDATLRVEWERVRTMVGQRTVKVKAPPRVEPINAPSRADAVKLIQHSRQELLATVQSVAYDELLAISMPHPFAAVGTLTGAGWLSATAFHDLRHIEQIREMKRS